MSIHRASENGNSELVRILAEQYDNDNSINHTDFFGNTPLTHASRNGHLECVNILLQCHNINVNTTNIYGQTALIAACEFGRFECVNALINAGANVNHIDNNYQTALMRASRYKFSIHNRGKKCVDILLQCPDIDVYLTSYGSNALTIAQDNKQMEIVKILKERMVIDMNFLWSFIGSDITRHIINEY